MGEIKNKIIVEQVELYFEKIITNFGNSAKVDCPKKFIGRKAIVIIEDGK